MDQHGDFWGLATITSALSSKNLGVATSAYMGCSPSTSRSRTVTERYRP